ncbi:MAG: helicase-related protein [Giesbergeria sp.]|uniref:helicase-related protein n=1 Tax=Giesbergeria sp. TaxID=2818473 RepID=UPI0026042869|nr:helicase-related protein [Giesbergeria sp.]MDD2610903.1 helicase-related protein [Giesbergeria sp.]
MGTKTGNDLFIVDNSDAEWKVLNYLSEWAEISSRFDIATGYFEIGALLALDGQWQKLDQIRILMGDEVTKRTHKALAEGIARITAQLDDSIEREKTKNDFLTGVPAIVQALASGQIKCRVYTKKKFHAKAYITHSKLAVVGSSALVGSSNFTSPGLTGNVELNVQLRREVEELQQWYEAHWDDAEDVSAAVLKVIERHTREYLPFEVYAKALQAYFQNYEQSAGDWERHHSRMYGTLDQYQRDGYGALLKIGAKFGGAFLCDGVGLGKTFVGLMLIERLVKFERKKVLLIVSKSGREPVWESSLRRYLPELFGDFSNLVIINHTDLQRGGTWVEKLQRLKEQADVVVVDEAHHFRNPSSKKDTSRYWQMQDLAKSKQVFMLTATPINNRLMDLQHLIEHFTQREAGHFKETLGIHSLPGHFRKLEKDLAQRMGSELLQGELPGIEAGDLLAHDNLFRSLVVQRSRAYVKQSQITAGAKEAMFPKREAPKLAEYSVKKTYGKLLRLLEKAFNKKQPLFTLPMYYPLAYSKVPVDDGFAENRQKQVVGLIRILFLKRFESSARAFEASCWQLLYKMMAFVQVNSSTKHEQAAFERWKIHHSELLGDSQARQNELFDAAPTEEQDEDIIPEEMLEAADKLDRNAFDVPQILSESLQDLNQIAEFLDELRQFKPSHDDKLRALIHLLKTDPVLKKHKVMIFSEFMATARYLASELGKAGIQGIDQIDSATKRSRSEVIRQFAPYYNGLSSSDLQAQGLPETRVLIATDVLSEGLNLQDATRLINYDLHWNPVRLMQRIGRVDRRMNPDTEKKLLQDHPEVQTIRGSVEYWNFLPPGELDELLSLYKKVSNKTLLISKTLGIETGKLLRPDDAFEALKDFDHAYEGEPSALETMHLEYQRLLAAHPDLPARLAALPGRVFSGKAHLQPDTHAVFFCFGLPGKDHTITDVALDADAWTLAAGRTEWLLLDLHSGQVLEDAAAIDTIIRCTPETPRQCRIAPTTLAQARAKAEKHLKNGYLRQVQAPAGVGAQLLAWMELN